MFDTASRSTFRRPTPEGSAPYARGTVGMRSSAIATALFDVLDPIPYAFFVGALIFDAIYVGSGEVLWVKSAAWLIAMGLPLAIVPRFIDLARVWFPYERRRVASRMLGFWLNLLAIVLAICNAFVHSRDAYGVMPEGLWLSGATVVLMVIAKIHAARLPSNGRASS